MSQLTDEAGEKVERILIDVSQQGVRVAFNAGTKLTHKTVTTSLKAATKAIEKIPGLPGQPEHGKMTVKALQRKTNDGLHAIEIPPEMLKGIQHELKKRGVDFAIDKAQDGNYYVQIQGKDADTMKHALKQVQAKLSKPQTRQDLKKDIEKRAQDKKEAKAKAPAKKKARTAKATKGVTPKPTVKL